MGHDAPFCERSGKRRNENWEDRDLDWNGPCISSIEGSATEVVVHRTPLDPPNDTKYFFISLRFEL